MRTNVILPNELVAEIDKLAGSRKRSEFLARAARMAIENEKIEKAFSDAKGILKDDPKFSTRAKVRKYIRDFRLSNSLRY